MLNSQQDNKGVSPLMKQYFEIKQKHPEALLMFQVGDFYELFFDDAQRASQYLGITLTKRGSTLNGEPIPLCGVPVQSLDHYVSKLVKGGFRIAICDQTELPKPGKIVNREITQVLTPGTLTDSKLLDAKSPSYICAFSSDSQYYSLVFAELLTGYAFATIIPIDIQNNSQKTVEAELARFLPDEILISKSFNSTAIETRLKQLGFALTFENLPENSDLQEWIITQFGQNTHNYIIQYWALYNALSIMHNYLKKIKLEL